MKRTKLCWIYLAKQRGNWRAVCAIIKTGYNDIHRRRVQWKQEKINILFHLSLWNKRGAGEFCIHRFNTKERNGIEQFKLRNLKMIGLRRSVGEAICALCQEEETYNTLFK